MLATVLGPSVRRRTMLVPAAAVTVAGHVWLVDTRPALVVLGHSTVLLHTDDVARVARARSRSVVLIHAVTRDRPPPSTRTSRDEAVGHDVLGSGTVVDPDGFVLTNAHVVDGAGAVYVRVADRDEDAVVVAVDRECDLALLRAPEPTVVKPPT